MTFIDGTLLARKRPRIYVVAFMAALTVECELPAQSQQWWNELEHSIVFVQLEERA